MRPTKPLLLSAAVLFCACISLPDIEDPTPPPPSVTVALAAPSGTTYTNGAVSVQLQLQGDTPEQVELLVDDQPLTTLQTPYTFTWNTASVTEGQHRLSARARIADKTFSSESREVIVDRTPPQVVSRTPTPGAQDVWVRQPIQATFSEPVKPDTVTSDSVKLVVGGVEATASLSLSMDGKTLTVVPNPALRASTNPQITMTSGVSDLAGNALSIPSAPWAWSLPISFRADSLSAVTGATDAGQPFLQPDSQGRMFVVWREQVASNKVNLYVYRQTNDAWEPLGGAVNEAPYILTPDDLKQFHHMLRLDSTGNPVAAWINVDAACPGIFFKRWMNGEWVAIGGPLNPYPSSSTAPFSFTFQLDANDKPFVVWGQLDDSSRPFIYVAKWTGLNWEVIGGPFPADSTTTSTTNDSPPTLILDRSGAPIIAWSNRSSDPGSNGITVQHWNGGSWESVGGPIADNPQTLPLTRAPLLALDSSGNPIITWIEANVAVNLHVRRWTGTSWEPLGGTLSATPGDTFTYSPDLAIDTLGNIFLAWLEPDESNTLYIHLRHWSGEAWEPLGSLMTQGTISRPSLRIGQSGIPYVAWSQGDSSTSTPATIRIHRYNY